MTVTTTRIFKSGNSMAVRIPKDMTPADLPDEAQIEWRNGVWIIRPLHRRTLAGLMERFKAFSPDFMAVGRDFHEQADRDWMVVHEPEPRKTYASAVERASTTVRAGTKAKAKTKSAKR